MGSVQKTIRAIPILRRTARRFLRVCSFCGVDPLRFVHNVAGLPRFIRDARSYSSKHPPESFRIHMGDFYPILYEGAQEAGTANGAYFHQDLWAARKIFQRKPGMHIDIGSRIDGFIAHLLSFMPVTVIDIRAIQSQLQGLTFIQDDATQLARFEDNSANSISTLHAAEHFGLGRYSDPVDPDACFRFMDSLQRVLLPGGRLYFSVPIGRERVEFNAHRVFAASTVICQFAQLSLVSFSFVDDAGDLHEDFPPDETRTANYGCGLFEFTKLHPQSSHPQTVE